MGICTKKAGRGKTRQLLVKWTGYAKPTWEPLSALQDTTALDIFEEKYGKIGSLSDFTAN